MARGLDGDDTLRVSGYYLIELVPDLDGYRVCNHLPRRIGFVKLARPDNLDSVATNVRPINSTSVNESIGSECGREVIEGDGSSCQVCAAVREFTP